MGTSSADVVVEVLVSLMAGWKRVRSSKPLKDGWLHYELHDGTVGLAQPKHWRSVDRVTGETVGHGSPNGTNA